MAFLNKMDRERAQFDQVISDLLQNQNQHISISSLNVTLSASPSAFACMPNFTLNYATQTCCPPIYSLPTEASRAMWTNSCSWTCLPPYVRWGLSCLTCSERNALALDRTKPAFSVWDDSGSSPNCTAWICESGYLVTEAGMTCVRYQEALQACAAYTSCAMCSLGPGCVWCNQASGCVPGKARQSVGSACAYHPNGTLGCSCEAAGCPYECTQHSSCEPCMRDSLCRWCQGTGRCALDLEALAALQGLTMWMKEKIARAWSKQACAAGWIGANASRNLGIGMIAACPPEGMGWSCNVSFRKSPVGFRLCCPKEIANSSPAVPDPSGNICGVRCDVSFGWNASATACSSCQHLPSDAEWIPNEPSGKVSNFTP
jgi:hypothetical protein